MSTKATRTGDIKRCEWSKRTRVFLTSRHKNGLWRHLQAAEKQWRKHKLALQLMKTVRKKLRPPPPPRVGFSVCSAQVN